MCKGLDRFYLTRRFFFLEVSRTRLLHSARAHLRASSIARRSLSFGVSYTTRGTTTLPPVVCREPKPPSPWKSCGCSGRPHCEETMMRARCICPCTCICIRFVSRAKSAEALRDSPRIQRATKRAPGYRLMRLPHDEHITRGVRARRSTETIDD